jgi:hypothetical protein
MMRFVRQYASVKTKGRTAIVTAAHSSAVRRDKIGAGRPRIGAGCAGPALDIFFALFGDHPGRPDGEHLQS